MRLLIHDDASRPDEPSGLVRGDALPVDVLFRHRTVPRVFWIRVRGEEATDTHMYAYIWFRDNSLAEIQSVRWRDSCPEVAALDVFHGTVSIIY